MGGLYLWTRVPNTAVGQFSGLTCIIVVTRVCRFRCYANHAGPLMGTGTWAVANLPNTWPGPHLRQLQFETQHFDKTSLLQLICENDFKLGLLFVPSPFCPFLQVDRIKGFQATFESRMAFTLVWSFPYPHFSRTCSLVTSSEPPCDITRQCPPKLRFLGTSSLAKPADPLAICPHDCHDPYNNNIETTQITDQEEAVDPNHLKSISVVSTAVLFCLNIHFNNAANFNESFYAYYS